MSKIRDIYFNNSASTTGQRILFKGGLNGIPTSYSNNVVMDLTFMMTNCSTVAVASGVTETYGSQAFILCSYGDPSNTTKSDCFILVVLRKKYSETVFLDLSSNRGIYFN